MPHGAGSKSQGFQYSGSNDWAAVAWYYENTDNRTHPVGEKQANELGLFGHVGERPGMGAGLLPRQLRRRTERRYGLGARRLRSSRHARRLLVRQAELRPLGQPLLVHHVFPQQQPRLPPCPDGPRLETTRRTVFRSGGHVSGSIRDTRGHSRLQSSRLAPRAGKRDGRASDLGLGDDGDLLRPLIGERQLRDLEVLFCTHVRLAYCEPLT